MRITNDIKVEMRDGVKISLRLYQPDDDQSYPTLFAISPYRYDTDDIPVHNLFQWRETGPVEWYVDCLLYTSPSPRDRTRSRMPSSA